MTTATGARTQHRSVRVDDDTWTDFGSAAREHGGRASVLRRLIHLYMTDRDVRHRALAYGDDLAREHKRVAASREALTR